MEEMVPLIRESIIGAVGGGFWVDRFSLVGSIQAYSDKSCQTLKAGSHIFLPLRLSTLNLTQAVRQAPVSTCDTIVAHLPVDIVRVETQEGDESAHPDDVEFGDEDDNRVPTAGTKNIPGGTTEIQATTPPEIHRGCACSSLRANGKRKG
jgi:hypothetical protein